MTIRTAMVMGVLLLIMQPAASQDQPEGAPIAVDAIEIGKPVGHFVLCDLDGDGLNDAFFVTATRPAICVVARRLGPKAGFGPPFAAPLSDICEGIFVQPTQGGAIVLSLAGGELTPTRFSEFTALGPGALPAGPAPAFLGFAQDLDGDRIGDPLAPMADGFEIVLSKSGRRVRLAPPIARERTAGTRGLLSERTRYPLVSLETLGAGAPPRPCFFANDALLALKGTLETGFGPGVDVVLKVPSPQQEASLERTEARLVDLEADGARELLVVRTKTQGTALAQVRTELIFHKIGGPTAGRPIQAILLPGILSSGPDIKDVDRDGRLDLFLSVFGEDLTQQVARRITGRVRLEYLLYRGAAGSAPFSRSPDFTEVDPVPEARFSDWDLRHRLILDDDWSGDGVPDLVEMSVSASATRLAVRPGEVRDGKARFSKSPSRSAETPIPVKDQRAWRLSASEPAIICRTATGAVIFSRGGR